MWGSDVSVISVLFYLNRYIAIVAGVLLIMEKVPPPSFGDNVCPFLMSSDV